MSKRQCREFVGEEEAERRGECRDRVQGQRRGRRGVGLGVPVVRFEAPHLFCPSFAAHGTKIFAMRPSACSPGIPVFDTETLGVTTCPFPRSRTALGALNLVHASVGNNGHTLLAFCANCLELLPPQPDLPTDDSSSSSSSWSFCVVECRVLPEEDYDADPRRRELTVTSFLVKYDKDGELVTGQCRAYASVSYQTARRLPNLEREYPIAFWM
ncbi:hypothetical protein EJB05_25224, partial [Eragrostis curvula]